MKKKILCLLTSLTIMLSTIGLSGASASTTGYNYNTAKIVTLFFTQFTTDGSTLNTSFDWNTFANSDATGVVIIPYWPVSVSGTYYNLYNIGRSGLTSRTTIANTIVAAANELIDANSSIKIWVGTPGIDSTCYSSATSSNCLSAFTDFITTIKTNLGTTRWSNNVVGVYYNQESIYNTVNYSSLISNAEIKLMNDFAYRVHTTFYKDLMWIPYYGYGTNAATIIKNIGYIANTTNIFDCVIMQPSYMANNDTESYSNFAGICASVDNQYVCYRNGVNVVTKPSTVKTVIGAEMELNTYNTTTYSTYVSFFSGYVGSNALAYYWQGDLATAVTTIDSFY